MRNLSFVREEQESSEKSVEADAATSEVTFPSMGDPAHGITGLELQDTKNSSILRRQSGAAL